MPVYRIPLSDTAALEKLRPRQRVEKDGRVKVTGKVVVKRWTIILPSRVVEVETEEEVPGLEKYKA